MFFIAYILAAVKYNAKKRCLVQLECYFLSPWNTTILIQIKSFVFCIFFPLTRETQADMQFKLLLHLAQ